MKPRKLTTSLAVLAALLVMAFIGISGCAHQLADSTKLNAELLLAAQRGDTESVKRLVAQGADPEAKNESGLTALALAADFGHADTTNFLLQQGADPVAGGISGKDALVDTARTGNASKLQLLLQRGADAAAKKEALFATCESEPSTRVISLAESDQRTEVRQPQQSVSLPRIDHAEVARLLLDAGVDLEARHETGGTPLIWAALFGATDIVELLLGRGAKTEAKDNDGDTALIAAACDCAIIDMPDTHDSMELLLSHGANIDAKGKNGTTALMRAAGWGRTDIVKLLLQRGANVNVKDIHGETALKMAIDSGEPETIRLLREAATRPSNSR